VSAADDRQWDRTGQFVEKKAKIGIFVPEPPTQSVNKKWR
jgi:hypothetical protein